MVRELYSALIHRHASEAWPVATTGFSEGARSFARNKSIGLLAISDIPWKNADVEGEVIDAFPAPWCHFQRRSPDLQV
jgi:hypothetical protein